MASPIPALADHLGIGRFAVLAHSLGSAFALACGPALADRLAVIVIASGMGPLPPGEGFHPRSRAEDLCWRLARSYRQGTTVMAADLVRYSRPWGFRPGG